MPKRIPYAPISFLRWFCHSSHVEEIEGDIEELYIANQQEQGNWSAYFRLWLDVFVHLRPQFFKKFQLINILNDRFMIKNYTKVTIRSLVKNKGFSLINITGLGLGMSFILIIVLFIKDQKTSDSFHENTDLIVRVYTTDTDLGWDVDGYASTPAKLAPYIRNNYNDFEAVTSLKRMSGSFVKDNEGLFVQGFYTDPEFLQIFDFSLSKGNSKTALIDPYSIIISEETANKFFGDSDPLNQTMTLEDMGEFKVTGVLKSISDRSHLEFETLVSFSTLEALVKLQKIEDNLDNWETYLRYYTYGLLKPDAKFSSFKAELANIGNEIYDDPEASTLGLDLQHLSAINLGMNLWQKMPNTMPRLDIFFIPFLAGIIMFLACFNYIIMSIARSLKRSKEVGLRKVVGSKKSQIVALFLSETFMITFIALVCSCVFTAWLIPIINSVDAISNNDMQINIELLKDPAIYGVFLLVAAAVSIVSGLYPAIYLSFIQPIDALQGTVGKFSNLRARKFLLGIQFTFSLVSIIFIAYFYQLNAYWTTIDRGIKVENSVGLYMKHVNPQLFKNEVISNSMITGVSLANQMPVFNGPNYIRIRRQSVDEPRYGNYFDVDPMFIENFELELISGRNFTYQNTADQEYSIIVNERLVEYLDLGNNEDAIGKSLVLNDSTEVSIIGVINNFHYKRFFKGPIESFLLRYKPNNFSHVNVHYVPGAKAELKEYLTSTYKEFDTLHELSFQFSDDAQAEVDNNTSGTIAMTAWASGIIVLLALFGLLGMSTYTTQMRIQEIGIRKVLGASVAAVALVLSKSYIKIILISSIIALPAAYFLTDAIMQFTTFRPPLNIWVLPASLLFIMLLTLLTIGSQTIKAAMTNPVKSIQNE